jgi:GH35 family endo-1,4-beta-xylanase
VELALRDWDERVLFSRVEDWAGMPGAGERQQRSWRIPWPGERNFFEATVRFVPDEHPAVLSRATWTSPDVDAGDPGLDPESPWGMGVYLYRYGHDAEGHAKMDRAAAMAQAAGVKWSREEFGWARIEPKEGEYDFSFYDVVVDTALRHGISVYGLLSYWSSWTEPYTEEGIEDFCRWARQVVLRYKDRVHHWEVYNEPNIFFWQGPKELYPLLLKRCYETIREADPTAKVLGISTAGIDQAFIKQCLEAGAPFDILTIHPYRTALSDRGFMKELKETSRLVNGRPVWITEMGWSTQMGATTEREQAVLLARCYLAATASGACDNVSWYNFRNDGNDPRYNEHNFGVIRSDLTPKPGYRALATICSILAGGVPVLDEEFPEPVLAVHGPEGSALWSPSTACEVELELPDGISIWNLMGEPVQFSPENGRAWISVPEGAPVFFIGGKPAPTGELRLPFGIDAVELVKF